MQVQRQVEEKLRARALQDLTRIATQTIRALQTISPTTGVGGRVHLYGVIFRFYCRCCFSD